MRPQDNPRGVDNLAKSMERNCRRRQAKKWLGEDGRALSLCSLHLVPGVLTVNKHGEGLASGVEDSGSLQVESMAGESERRDEKKRKDEKQLGSLLAALNMEEDHKLRNVMASKSWKG